MKRARVLNNNAIIFLKNFLHTFLSNLVSLVISAIVVLVVPKLIGVEEYGYWQLYLFYSSYVGLLHFGWNDGIYLRYGGKEYKELNKGLFFSQFWMLAFIQFVFVVSVFVILAEIPICDSSRIFIIQMSVICSLIVNCRTMLFYILQGTNRIGEYAQSTIRDRLLYCLLIAILLFIGIRDYKLMIVADLVGKLYSLLFSAYECKEIVFRETSAFYFSIKETIENINAGIKLMFANIASMLIIGIVRFGIERAWDITSFGKVSLTLSVSGLMMIFINTLGIILFPLLRRTDENNLPNIYTMMRTLLMALLMGLLITYYPLKVILSAWLPQYAESLMYMALIFPMCVYEGKMTLLINTYYKTMRMEKLMLINNGITVILSIVFTFLTTLIMQNLILSVMSILLLLAFRCSLAEVILAKKLNISPYKDILLDMAMSSIFILTGWFTNWLAGIAIYFVAYSVYVWIKRSDIIITVKSVNELARG
jgi:O-antigen/teichoic acid export membrane protein